MVFQGHQRQELTSECETLRGCLNSPGAEAGWADRLEAVRYCLRLVCFHYLCD